MKIRTGAAIAACLLSSSPLVFAQPAAREPEGVVSLSASAAIEVPNDWITVDFSAQEEGADATAVQARLKDDLAGALALARRAARPDGQVEVQGEGFSLQPRFDPKNGRLNGWSGSTRMRVQGRDMAAIAALAGQVTTMSVLRLDYEVARQTREKVEGEAVAQAIARFRAEAADEAKAFGYGGFVLREVNVGTDGQAPVYKTMMSRRTVPAAPMPVEAGKGTVSATVSGSVQLVK